VRLLSSLGRTQRALRKCASTDYPTDFLPDFGDFCGTRRDHIELEFENRTNSAFAPSMVIVGLEMGKSAADRPCRPSEGGPLPPSAERHIVFCGRSGAGLSRCSVVNREMAQNHEHNDGPNGL